MTAYTVGVLFIPDLSTVNLGLLSAGAVWSKSALRSAPDPNCHTNAVGDRVPPN